MWISIPLAVASVDTRILKSLQETSSQFTCEGSRMWSIWICKCYLFLLFFVRDLTFVHNTRWFQLQPHNWCIYLRVFSISYCCSACLLHLHSSPLIRCLSSQWKTNWLLHTYLSFELGGHKMSNNWVPRCFQFPAVSLIDSA